MIKSKYVRVAEVAKLVRQSLKEAFPGVKFNVRSSSYAGGGSIGVIWTDGPSTLQVEAIADRFASTFYDMKRDYWEGLRHRLNGELVSFGSHHIQCVRKHSDAWCAEAIKSAYELHSELLSARGVNMPSVKDFFDGQLHAVRLYSVGYEPPVDDGSPFGDPFAPHYPSLRDEVSRILAERSDRVSPLTSATAVSVAMLVADNLGVNVEASSWARALH